MLLRYLVEGNCTRDAITAPGVVPVLRPDGVLLKQTNTGEERFISYGQLGLLVIVAVVHTSRDGMMRLISARKANRNERENYYEHLEETAQGN